MNEELIHRLRAFALDEQILPNEPLAPHTTMRVGGPADVFFLPDSAAQVRFRFDERPGDAVSWACPPC